MNAIIPKAKMSKKARKEMDRIRRVTWGFSPVSRKRDSQKIYKRKESRIKIDEEQKEANAQYRIKTGMGAFP